MYSAPTIATAYDAGVRLMVDTTRVPPGASTRVRVAMNASGFFTCSMTSEASTTSYGVSLAVLQLVAVTVLLVVLLLLLLVSCWGLMRSARPSSEVHSYLQSDEMRAVFTRVNQTCVAM